VNSFHDGVIVMDSVLGESANVTDVTILNPIMGKDYDDDKVSLLDVLAEDASGQKLNIEMQTTLPAGIFQRLAYYTASLYVEQLKAQAAGAMHRLNVCSG